MRLDSGESVEVKQTFTMWALPWVLFGSKKYPSVFDLCGPFMVCPSRRHALHVRVDKGQKPIEVRVTLESIPKSKPAERERLMKARKPMKPKPVKPAKAVPINELLVEAIVAVNTLATRLGQMNDPRRFKANEAWNWLWKIERSEG